MAFWSGRRGGGNAGESASRVETKEQAALRRVEEEVLALLPIPKGKKGPIRTLVSELIERRKQVLLPHSDSSTVTAFQGAYALKELALLDAFTQLGMTVDNADSYAKRVTTIIVEVFPRRSPGSGMAPPEAPSPKIEPASDPDQAMTISAEQVKQAGERAFHACDMLLFTDENEGPFKAVLNNLAEARADILRAAPSDRAKARKAYGTARTAVLDSLNEVRPGGEQTKTNETVLLRKIESAMNVAFGLGR